VTKQQNVQYTLRGTKVNILHVDGYLRILTAMLHINCITLYSSNTRLVQESLLGSD